jgi:hypothetical protein
MDAEAEAVDLEAHFELVAEGVAGGFARLDEAAVEAEIENPTAARIPVVDAELDGTVASVTRGSAAVFSIWCVESGFEV